MSATVSLLLLVQVSGLPCQAQEPERAYQKDSDIKKPIDTTRETRTAHDAIHLAPLPTTDSKEKPAGALYYKRPEGTPPQYETPPTFDVDPHGVVTVLENHAAYNREKIEHRGLMRAQRFQSTGSYLGLLHVDAMKQQAGRQLGVNPKSLSVIRLQSPSPDLIYLEARVRSPDGFERGVIGQFDADGNLQKVVRHPSSRYVIFDTDGWLWEWVRPNEKWKVYRPNGELERTIRKPGGFVGPDANLYVRRETDDEQAYFVVDKNDNTLDTLAITTSQDYQAPGFFWGGQLQTDRFPHTRFPVVPDEDIEGPARRGYGTMASARVRIRKVSRERGRIDSVGTVRLPSIRKRRSTRVDLPLDIWFWYPKELIDIRGDTLYALAFSLPITLRETKPQYHLVKVNLKEYFWHEKHHGPDYLKKYSALHEKSADQLRLLRNEIFARYGYTFSSQELQQHFEHTDWYKPDPDFSTDRLSKEETWLAQRLKELEEVKREEALESEGTE